MKNQDKIFKVLLNANKWDSKYFGLKIGNLEYHGARAPKNLTLDMICKKVKNAEKSGYKYLIFSFSDNQSYLHDILPKSGFTPSASYIDLVSPVDKKRYSSFEDKYDVKVATKSELVQAQDIAATAFRLSWTYRLKFASKKDIDSYHRTWVRNLHKGSVSTVFVAKFQGKIYGFLGIKENPKDKSARIILVAADKKMKGKGVGSALNHTAFGWAKGKNIKKIYVKTQAENVQALGFYKKHGFKLYSRDYKYHMYL